MPPDLKPFVYFFFVHPLFRIPPLKLFTFRIKYDKIGHSLQWRRETEVEDAKAKQERKPCSILRSKTASGRSQRPSLYDFVQKLSVFFPSKFEICDSIYQTFQHFLSCCRWLTRHEEFVISYLLFDLLSFDEFFWRRKIQLAAFWKPSAWWKFSFSDRLFSE